jgi:purine-cytosine permease-like protein
MLFTFLLFFSPFLTETLPGYAKMPIIWLLLAGFFFVSLFVWSEQAYDEREESQQLQMNKWAFITGGTSIIFIIIYQSLFSEKWLDLSLPLILLVMLWTKLLFKNYYRLKDNGYIKK